jgi:hypothetical protein
LIEIIAILWTAQVCVRNVWTDQVCVRNAEDL